MSKSKTPKLLLKVREYAGRPGFVTFWIVHREGAGIDAGLMWGEARPAVVDLIAEATGLPVEREQSPLSFQEGKGENIPPGCATLKEQDNLFSNLEPEAP